MISIPHLCVMPKSMYLQIRSPLRKQINSDLNALKLSELIRKEMVYLTMQSFLIRLYGVGYVVKDHSYSKRKPAAATT